jgi:hypothetical protein
MARLPLRSVQELHESRAMLAAWRGKRALFVAQRALRRESGNDGRKRDIFDAGGRHAAFLQTAAPFATPVRMNAGSQTRPETEKHELDSLTRGKWENLQGTLPTILEDRKHLVKKKVKAPCE